MKLGGETVALANGSIGLTGAGLGGFANMLAAGAMQAPPPAILPSSQMQPYFHPSNVFSNSSGLCVAPQPMGRGSENPSTVGAEEQQQGQASTKQAQLKEELESESKSSSDNNHEEGGSGGEDPEEAAAADPSKPRKRRFHRHTIHQIQEMERLFKECPHPDEKQRQELSRELNLSPRQIKFWFQNKRTQMKAHQERQDNSVLRTENEKLKAENYALRDAVRNISCPSCGGPATLAEMSFEEQQLRIENVRLQEEIERITALAAKYSGIQAPMPSMIPQLTTTSSSSALDSLVSAPPPMSCSSAGINNELATVADIASRPFGLTDEEKPLVVELAVVAMEELLQVVAPVGEVLWLSDPNGEAIDYDAYVQRFPRGIGPTPPGLKPESSRHTGLVIMNSASLVESLMDVNRWSDMFSSIISRAQTVEVLSTGIAGTYDGAIQLMYGEFQVPSPLVPTRENYFLRYSKRVDHLWVVVDVSIDSLRGNPPPALLRCRRRPSGCVIEEMPSGYSKVTWVEHVEADNRGVHDLYRSFVCSGLAFGARRWLCTLQRQCERIASVLANNIPARDLGVIPNAEGRRSILKLAERMTNNFCGGVNASTAHTWVTLAGNGADDDVRVVIRKSVDEPPTSNGSAGSGRPPGIVLSAATSLWLPVSPARLFQFLRDERFRTEWDILSNTGIVEEVFHVAKGQDPGNCVSLLRVNPISSNQSNMLILQECCTDESCSLVVYAPVDIAAMGSVLHGGDPECVALLPSGFAILPDGPALHSRPPSMQQQTTAGSGGSLLTVAFQILVDHMPTAKLNLTSIATVNKLISNTVIRIKGALSCGTAHLIS